MLHDNLIADLSENFALRIIKMYNYLRKEKKNTPCLFRFIGQAQVLVQMCQKVKMLRAEPILSVS